MATVLNNEMQPPMGISIHVVGQLFANVISRRHLQLRVKRASACSEQWAKNYKCLLQVMDDLQNTWNNFDFNKFERLFSYKVVL